MVNLPNAEPTSVAIAPQPRIVRARLILLLIIVLLIGAGIVAWIKTGLTAAQTALSRHEPTKACRAVERYLSVFSSDTEARLLAGKAYLQDDQLAPLVAADKALSHLAKIPDESPQGAEARTVAGRATFLVKQEPSHAERLFRQAIKLDPDQFDAHYLLWQEFNMTERYYESEPVFREVFRLCPPEQRAFRLREWYSSQFTPLSACGELDLMMGYRMATEVPSEAHALARLTAFHEYEPLEPTTTAAIAQWHLRNLNRDAAVELLDSITDRETIQTSPFYQATLVEALIESGQIDRARQEFSQWTGPEEGYQYLRIAGIFAHDVEGDLPRAAQILKRATETWPGPADWLLLTRLSRCLALQGMKDESVRVGQEAKRVEGLTEMAVHQKVRMALGNLEDPLALEEVVKFYELFGRDWEANAWREVIANLKKPTK